MTHIITSLCLRDGGCIEVCPVDCIIGGDPEEGWPQMYIDPETCIDCGACIPECPFEAIFPEEEVPDAFEAAGGEFINRVDLNGDYEGEDIEGNPVILTSAKELDAGEIIDLTEDIQSNYDFFEDGPGYGD